jgi:hypothetical protein
MPFSIPVSTKIAPLPLPSLQKQQVLSWMTALLSATQFGSDSRVHAIIRGESGPFPSVACGMIPGYGLGQRSCVAEMAVQVLRTNN